MQERRHPNVRRDKAIIHEIASPYTCWVRRISDNGTFLLNCKFLAALPAQGAPDINVQLPAAGDQKAPQAHATPPT